MFGFLYVHTHMRSAKVCCGRVRLLHDLVDYLSLIIAVNIGACL